MNKIYQKLVIKLGSNVLTRPDGHLDITNISHLVDQMVALKQAGTKIVLVSSGAVAAGRSLLPHADRLDDVIRRQMLSSIGQVRLMELYRQFFESHQILCGQVLATKEDFRDRKHYLYMRNCFEALLDDRIIPIVNENDVISVTELMFTDNDELAGLVAAMINADALIILSTVDGLYAGSPDDPDAQLIETIDADDESVFDFIAPVKSSFGRGGMATKIRMAQQTAKLGADVILANGRSKNILPQILTGKGHCTRIKAKENVSSIKKWIALHPKTKGTLHINNGALNALSNPKNISSLLPIGLTAIKGNFKKGDIIDIVDPENNKIGVGMAQYDATEAIRLLGLKGQKPVIHYDYLMVF